MKYDENRPPINLNRLRWTFAIGIVTALACAPFFRTIYDFGDEGTFLRAAELMLHGKRLYADFFEFIPPGSYLLTAAWFDVAGISMESARTLAVLTIVGIACFTFLACRLASQHTPLSAALVLAWVMMSQWHWMQVSHHWFTSLFSMIAAWAALASLEKWQPHSTRWSTIAGMATGTTIIIMQTCGVWTTLAAGAAFIESHRNRSKLITYLLGVTLAPVCAILFLASQHSLGAAFDSVVRFAATRYASIQYVPFGYGASIFDYPLKFVFPLAASLMLIACVRDWRTCLHDRRLWLCAALALAGLLSCFPRPDIAHIGFVAPLALPLLALTAVRLLQRLRATFHYAIVIMTAVLLSPTAASFASIVLAASDVQPVTTTKGSVAFIFNNDIPELLPHIAKTSPHDGFFFYPYMPLLTFLVARDHVSKYDVFVPGYTTQAQYHAACLSAVRQALWVVADRKFNTYSYWKKAYPAMPDAEPDEAIRFKEALDDAYGTIEVKGDFELRRRRDGASEAVCDKLSTTNRTSGVAVGTKPPISSASK